MACNTVTLKPFDKMPVLNVATLLLVGSEEGYRELIAKAILREMGTFEVKILSTVVSSIAILDANFFLGKVCFLATKGRHGNVQHAVDISIVKDLADQYLSLLIQTELDNEDDVVCTAKRLLNMLRICAGLVPGISSLYTGSIAKYE
ncbi:centromere protein M isoform X2 [Rhinoderma darwinii]|uniref:centromere protein M isoform X2 n=1 Tax=Rhinoderma darwinii TaxID=43563 RepID=UPI003F67B795